ncbi:MAG: ABC transporter ATP-binding protein [Pseudomonadota bacterium]
MAKIILDHLRHSYLANPASEADWALKQLDVEWEDGGAYALLGPSGCGKTTLLNIISGLIRPSEGRVLFDGDDVTDLPPDQRHIAQVFQFPVIYDTMTVYDNLAFPLRNRGVGEADVDARVRQIAELLELTDSLRNRAAGLTADSKQKISLGRGLVRSDVNVIMFDEPLTVIDPHLKWVLRSKLKELHHEIKVTMIYVTHDQTEALTIADRVVVMDLGEVVQIGTPVELFETPQHTFVGHFIGSPGMNVLACQLDNGQPTLAGQPVETANADAVRAAEGVLEIGVRPEFISFADQGIAVDVVGVSDAGRYRIVDTRSGDQSIKLLVDEDTNVPQGAAHLRFDPARTRVYRDGWLVT